jgi:phage repressor protein C with HTH and peptisase S24 domain
MSTVSVIGSTNQIGNAVGVSALRQIRERQGLTQKDVAKLLNTTDVSVSRYEKEDNRLTLPLMQRLAKALRCSIAEIAGEAALQPMPLPALIDGVVELMGEMYTAIDVYDAGAAAGYGAFNEDGEPLHQHLYRTQWLRTVTNAPPKDLAVIRVIGHSMEPTLHHGDHVLVDLTAKRISSPAIYVFRPPEGGEVQVKRIQRNLRTRLLTVASDNPSFPTQEGIEDDDLDLIGRVIWLGRNLGG